MRPAARWKVRVLTWSQEHIVFIIISVLLVALGHNFVRQCSVYGPSPYLTIQGDAKAYVSMIESDLTSAPAPFTYRVLVPLVARLLPFSPLESLRIISYASLFLAYLFAFLACRKLGLTVSASLGGILTAFASTWHLYNYHNPFLTDAFGLMVLTVMLYALLDGRFVLFTVFALAGVLARETTIFLVPAWFLVRDRLRGAILIGLAVAGLLVPRFVLSAPADMAHSFSASLGSAGSFDHPLAFIMAIVRSWGFRWIILLLGLCLIPTEKSASSNPLGQPPGAAPTDESRRFGALWAAGLLVGLGGVLSALVATDTGRMLAILFPVMAVASAQFLVRIFGRRYAWWGWMLVVLALAQAFFLLPNAVIGEGNWAMTSDWPRRLLNMAGVGYGVASAIVLRRMLWSQISDKWGCVTAALSRARSQNTS